MPSLQPLLLRNTAAAFSRLQDFGFRFSPALQNLSERPPFNMGDSARIMPPMFNHKIGDSVRTFRRSSMSPCGGIFFHCIISARKYRECPLHLPLSASQNNSRRGVFAALREFVRKEICLKPSLHDNAESARWWSCHATVARKDRPILSKFSRQAPCPILHPTDRRSRYSK